jgi:quercetin dioxygenase-like cupin family protein
MLTSILVAALPLFAAAVDDRVKIDNDFVRVLKVVDQPHQKTALHKHDPNRVMIYLTAGNLDVTYEDGKVEHQVWKAEDVAWSVGGPKHVSENVSAKPLGIVEVELKKPAPASPAHRDPKLDPIAIDPKHNVLLFENPQVRVFRTWREAGKSEMKHEHAGAGRVVVLLTDISAKVAAADGATSEMVDKAGEIHWTAGPIVHAGTNTGSKRFDMILIEVK